jgi:hypothetical protein
MASLTGNLVAETYKALLKTIDNDILTASEKQITDGFGGGSNVFIDSNGFLRANQYKVTNGLATQFLKADGSLDANTYLTSINSSQIIAALGFTPVTNARTLTINGTTYDLSANRSWTIAGTSAVWGNITGTLSNQTDLQTALNAKFNNPTGTISQYIRGDGSIATFPTLPGGLPIGGTTGQILAKINATDYNTEWIDNFATQTKNEVKLGQTLTKGTAVYISSANGTNMIVSAASNTTEALSSKTFGLLETGGSTNAFVKCVTFGLLAGLDTSTATAGDPVWLGVNGALIFGLANKPYAPAHLVYIGIVTRVQSNNGEIFVNVQDGFELKEIHDVAVQTPSNNDGLFFETATSLWKNKSIATVLGYTPQAQLSGTGFVKASGTTISYDNSTYLTTTVAASTYQRLDKMVSNLLASATEYPNSNAVIAALALKADALNPVFTGNMTISGAEPKLTFTDTDQNPDYFIGVDAGFFRIYDQTAGLTRFVINSSGVTTIAGDLIVGTIAKTGGTAAQFLKADGTIDSSTYVTSATLANYLLSATAATTYQTLANLSTDLTASATKYPSVNAVVTGLGTKQPLDADLTAIAALVGTTGFLIKTAADTWSLDTNTYLTTTSAASTYLTQTTAASTYQRLDKMVSNLLASSTEYPNSNAVLAKLALKADAANPVFTGDLTISGATPRLYFVDTDQNPDYTIFVDSGYFYIYDQTAGATRFSINSSGNATFNGRVTFQSGIDTRPQMPGGFVGLDTGDGDFDIWGISREYYPSHPTTANKWGIRWNGANNDLEFVGAGTNRVIIDLDIGTITGASFVKSGGTGSQFLMADGSVTTGVANPVGGTGTANRITKFTGTSTVGNSLLYDDGSSIGLGGFASAWAAGTEGVFQTKNASVYGYSNYEAGLVANAYYSGGWIRIAANTASMIIMNQNINFRVGATGSAGSAITWIEALSIINSGESYFISSVNARSATTSTGISNPAFIGKNEFLSTGTLAGFFWENRSGGVTSNSNWYGWYTTGGEIKLYNGASNILSIVGTSGVASFIGDVFVGTNSSSYSSSGRGLFVANGTSNALFGWSVAGVSKGYLYHSGASVYLENSHSGGDFFIVQVGAGKIIFNTNGNERARITSGGSLLVNGQTDVWSGSTNRGVIHVNGAVDAIYGITIGGVNAGYMYHSGSALFINQTRASCSMSFTNEANGGMTFGTNNTERFVISNTGNFGFGTSTMTYKFNFDGGSMYIPGGQSAASSAAYTSWNQLVFADQFSDVARGPNKIITYGRGTGWVAGIGIHNDTQAYYAGGTHKFYKFDGTTATQNFSISGVGDIVSAGSSTATSFFESSDIRLKTLIDGNPQIAGIENLQAKLYEKNGKIELGYFAQDAEKLMPYAVTKGTDGFLNLSYREVHTAKIARLEQRVAELEKQLNAA